MKLTADEAYKKFYSSPLVKAAGVDHASFCAGFDTCSKQYERLEAALPKIRDALQNSLPLLRQYIEEIGPCDHSVNICICGLIHVADQVSEALNVKAVRES